MNKPISDGRDVGAFISAALDDFGLDPYAMRIYTRIVRRAGTKDGCFESIDNMAAHCKMNRKTVFKSLKLLLQHRLIEKVSVQGKTSHYYLTPSNQWIPLDQPVPNQVYPTHTKSGTPPVPDQVHPLYQIRDTTCTVTGTQRISNQGNQIKEKKEGREHNNFSFSSNPEQANSETNEPDPAPTIPSLVVQKLNSETELEIQTDSEAQGKLIADVEEKETPLPPFADAFPSETSEEIKTECGDDPRFDKKIPFSGDITDSSYRNELKYFVPKLSGEFFEIGGIKRSFERQNAVNAKTLLCMLNEKGIDAIANLEKFIDFYYTKTLARTEHYKNHSFDKETLKVAVLKAITKKIADDDTEILIQLVSTFSKDAKAIANPQKPISEPLPEKKGIPFNPAFAEKLKSKQNQHRRKSSDISPLNLVNDVSSTLDHKTA